MRAKLTSVTAVVLFACGYPLSASAERIVLANGDSINVKIDSIGNNTLYATSDILGHLEIPIIKIDSIALAGSYWVRVKGQKKFQFVSFKGAGEEFYPNKPVASSQSCGGMCNIIALETKEPPAEPETPVAAPVSKIADAEKTGTITADDLKIVPKNQWLFSNTLAGYVNFDDIGGSKEKRSVTLSANGHSEARNTKNRHILDWSMENEEEDGDHDEEYKLAYSYNYFISKKTYTFSTIRYTHDDGETPYKVTTLTGGLGYQIFDNNDISLRVEGGPGYTFQRFRSKSNSNSTTAYAGLFYNQKITKDLSAFNDTTLNATFDSSASILDGKLGLKYQMTKNLWLELVHNYNWTDHPEKDFKPYNGNIKFGVGVGW